MPLPVGASVAVRTLGNKPGVVVQANSNGRYRVLVDNVTLSCREEDLVVRPDRDKKKRSGRARREPQAMISDAPVLPGRVDLHGLRVEEAIARVVTEIDHALRRDADRVEIVHGKGSGRLKEALHRHLASMPGLRTFRLDPHNPGVTWVLF
jgi:DNA mismatch repair protein MutS2